MPNPKPAVEAPGVQLERLREAAERKRIHVDTLRRAIARGDLTGYKFGPRILRVDAAEVDALFARMPTAKVS
jgi:excisionase family DNA binding protein